MAVSDKELTACRFSLYPMTDNYIDIILRSLAMTDTGEIYAETDAVSTVYAGSFSAVADAVQGLFIHAFRPGVHMAIEGEFGAEIPPGIQERAPDSFREARPNVPLTERIRFPVRGRYSQYSEGPEGLCVSSGELHGDVHRIFGFLERVYDSAERPADGRQPVLHFTINCNSPTEEDQ